MVRLETEVKQITHAIRMTAYNAKTALAAALDSHYPRARDEAYTLVREALLTSGDIIPGDAELLVRLDPSPRHGAPTRSLPYATRSTRPGPATPEQTSSCATKPNPTQALHDPHLYVRNPGPRVTAARPGRGPPCRRSCSRWTRPS